MLTESKKPFKHEIGGGEYWENEALSAKIDGFGICTVPSMVEIAKSFPKPRSYFGTKEVSDAYKNLAVYF